MGKSGNRAQLSGVEGVMGSAAEEPTVRRLPPGGKWIRTLGPARSLASNEAFYITGSSTPAFPPPERGAARLAAAIEAFMRRHGGTLCATPERWRRSMPTKTSKSKASEGKPNALQKPLQPSEELAAVVGTSPLPRGEVVSKIWEYIRSHNLQNPENRREILADDKLTKVFGTDKVTMFEMNKHLTRHLK
jgi:upstream activation factor subunit UAF30